MKLGPVLTATFILGTTSLFGQATTPQTEHPKASTRARAEAKVTDMDATYGRVKEFTAGQKIVIDVDNAVDKSFDLNDKDLKVTMAKGLKVGDPVKVVEHEKLGKTVSVNITKHSGGGVAHGDKDPAAKKP
jgi:hypothetical protein